VVERDDGADRIEAEKIRLVEADLAQTNEFVKGVLGTSAAIRGSAITIWLALLGFSIQQGIPTLALLAAVVSIALWIADGYHGWLYGEAFGHAQKIERMLANYYDDLSRRVDSQAAHIRFTAKLRAHRYGLYSGLQRGFTLKQLWNASRPYIFYRGLYPAIIIIAAGIAVLGFLGIDLRAAKPITASGTIEQSSAPQTSSIPPALSPVPSQTPPPPAPTSDASPPPG